MKHLFLFSALLVLLTSCQKQPNLTVRYEQKGNLRGPFVKGEEFQVEIITDAKKFELTIDDVDGKRLFTKTGDYNSLIYWDIPAKCKGESLIIRVTAFGKKKNANYQQLIKLYN